MIRLLNSERRYGAVAIALHWLMALLLIGLVAMGLYMVSLADAGYDAWKIRLILLHKELGGAFEDELGHLLQGFRGCIIGGPPPEWEFLCSIGSRTEMSRAAITRLAPYPVS